MSSSFMDDVRGASRAPPTSVDITLRADLMSRYKQLLDEHSAALRDDMAENRDPLAPGILRQARAVQDEMRASVRTIVMEALPQRDYNTLVSAYPPRVEDREMNMGFNGDEFPPVLIAACAIEVDEEGNKVGQLLTIEESVELCEMLSDAQYAKLWNAACACNIGDDAAPKAPLRSVEADGSETSSSTAENEGSLAASSSDGL